MALRGCTNTNASRRMQVQHQDAPHQHDHYIMKHNTEVAIHPEQLPKSRPILYKGTFGSQQLRQ
jgi:hypothetical protein